MINGLRVLEGVALAPASQTAAATRSANIDTLGYDYATIRVNCAAEVNTNASTPTIAVKESDDTTATNFATWSSSYSRNEDLASAHNVVFKIDLRGRKRYLNLSITAATHTTNDVVTASAGYTLERAEVMAAGTAALIASTNDVVVVG